MTPRAGKRVAIIGGGAWGTALACAARRAAASVVIWSRNPSVVADIEGNHENSRYLPGVTLEHAITASTDLEQSVRDAALVLLVVPAQQVRGLARALAAARCAAPVVICAKGIEQETGLLLHQVLQQELPGVEIAVLSGPTFAMEVAQGLPAAVTVAAASDAVAAMIVATLGRPEFRPYTSNDRVGVEVCGAVKNVLAIACGIVIGRKLGENAQAALLSRGLMEIRRLIDLFGGNVETALGLSGIGDLSLTCNSLKSRNTSLGFELGQGRLAAALLSNRGVVTEGVWTALALAGIAKRAGLSLPVCEIVAEIVTGSITINDAIRKSIQRSFKSELTM